MGSSENVPNRRKGREPLEDGTVRVWSEVGMTLPVADTTAHIRFLFGHERIAANSTHAELKRVERLIDEFNETVVAERVQKYTRLITAWQAEAEEDSDGTEGVRARARRRAKERQEGRS